MDMNKVDIDRIRNFLSDKTNAKVTVTADASGVQATFTKDVNGKPTAVQAALTQTQLTDRTTNDAIIGNLYRIAANEFKKARNKTTENEK